ncbi:MAG TPA: PAS domain-containing protein, partial [Myxococcota bacterium]|nr:PAS domain-containing protein [Myxococcota bacterium]
MGTTTEHRYDDGAPGLSHFLRVNQGRILQAWEQQARTLPQARNLGRLALLNSIPDLLEAVADLADALSQGRSPRLSLEVAGAHAHQRLDHGFDLAQVVAEYGLLRSSILGCLENDADIGRSALRLLNEAIDRAIIASVDQYAEARERTLRAIETVSETALGDSNLEDVLPRLLHVVLDTMESVDTAVIYLRHGEALRLVAAAGLEAPSLTKAGKDVPPTGFAKRIAARKRPLLIHSVSTSPLLQDEEPSLRELQVLYGVPLLHEKELVGVAHMGSLSTTDFSHQDKRLFGIMASRAASVIAIHMLHEETRSREVRLRLAASAGHLGTWDLDPVSGALVWDAPCKALFGLPPEATVTYETYLSLVHPDDRLRVDQSVREGLRPASGGAWEDQYRTVARQPNGEERWIRAQAHVLFDEAGRATRFIG